MKFLYRMSFLLLLIALVASTSFSQNPCLRLYCGSIIDTLPGPCVNLDSVMVDTCAGSSTYKQLYTKYWFDVEFKNYVLNLPAAPADTTLEVSWTAIDTTYSAIRNAFSVIESKYGTLWLKKYAPSVVDSTRLVSRKYQIRFDNYNCIDSVLVDLNNCPGLVKEVHYGGYPKYETKVLNILNNSLLIVSPNPASSALTISSKGPLLSVSIYDIQGKKVMEVDTILRTQTSIDVKELVNGTYFLKCDNHLTQIQIQR